VEEGLDLCDVFALASLSHDFNIAAGAKSASRAGKNDGANRCVFGDAIQCVQ
jgi:hypothetical protein